MLVLIALLLAAEKYPVEKLTPKATVIRGPVNGVLIRQNGKALAIYGDPRENAPAVERGLFTHGRRDVVGAGRGLVRRGAEAVGPAGAQAMCASVRPCLR